MPLSTPVSHLDPTPDRPSTSVGRYCDSINRPRLGPSPSGDGGQRQLIALQEVAQQLLAGQGQN